MSAEHKFNQSEAVTRCRGYKEGKLRGQYALAKLLDEEVTIHSANLDEFRNQLMTQQFEQRSFDKRQEAEAEDFKTGRDQKIQFTSLVNKLSALKLVLRFQEDNRETENAFKLSIRHKRAAFQVQLARLEKRQVAERKELMAAQTRLAQTSSTIRAIEVLNMKDQKLARQMKKKHAVLDQQFAMKQQKESQFLREIQLTKTKHLQQLTELDITNAEEMQEVIANQKAEEFELLAKQKIIESKNEAVLDKQLADAQALHIIERQKIIKIQLQRAQRKQQSELEKSQQAAARIREKVMIAENPLILNSTTSGLTTSFDATQSETSHTDSTSSRGDSSAVEEGDASTTEDDEEGAAKNIAKQNSEQNKGNSILTDEERELAAMLELGRERNRATVNHHKSQLKELRSQHKSQIYSKAQDQKRKVSELLKEQQEEMELLKTDQEQTLKELLQTQAANNADLTDTDNDASGLATAFMPEHIRADITAGADATPLKFESCTMACIEICGFDETCNTVGPVNAFAYISSVEEAIDATLSKFPDTFKVKFDQGSVIIASGLKKDLAKGSSHNSDMIYGIVECIEAIQAALSGIHCPGAPESTVTQVKSAIHTGPVTGGLVGNSFASYHLVGPHLTALKQLASTSEPAHVKVSENTKNFAEGRYSFEEHGEVDVTGLGRVATYWLK